ncbi:MAG: hypothetical protein ABR912_06235 [Terracidiphilus sp.]|jgi:hypothetical protein
MTPASRSPFFAQAIACWNWKCALLSATARSLVYLAAMARTGLRGGLSIVLVEMIYVTFTAGLYAGLQQRALGFRSRLLGNLTVVLGVPVPAQILDWLTHRAAGAAAPGRATLMVCIFTIVSALFHLHVMRRGVFLTGRTGRSLLNDFCRMPRLIAGFVVAPAVLLSALGARLARGAESEAAL